MRLDKFLKVSRLVKRRTLAKEICDAGRVTVNGRAAKASTDVDVGSKLEVRYGQKTVAVTILRILENPRKEEAVSLYEITSETFNNEINKAFVDDEDE